MASRITPNMARKIQKHWSDKESGEFQSNYFGQNEQTKRRSLPSQLGKFAKAMGYKKSSGDYRSYDRAAYEHINNLAKKTDKKEKDFLARKVTDAQRKMDKEFKAGRGGTSAQQSIRRANAAENNYYEAHNRKKT
jgi:hypothetical protein